MGNAYTSLNIAVFLLQEPLMLMYRSKSTHACIVSRVKSSEMGVHITQFQRTLHLSVVGICWLHTSQISLSTLYSIADIFGALA